MNKKIILVLLSSILFTGCESISFTEESSDIATDEMTQTLNDLNDIDFSNKKIIKDMTHRVAESYSCLIESTNELHAKKIIANHKEDLKNKEIKYLIDKAIIESSNINGCVFY